MEYIWCLLLTTICPCLSLLQGTNNPSTGELLSLITQLNQTLQTQSSILAVQNRTITTQSQKIAVLETTGTSQSQKIVALKTTVAAQSQKITALESSNRQQVSFYATQQTQQQLGERQTIEFDHVITNVGNGFDVRHSHFTAPVKGIYIFTVDVMSMYTAPLHIELEKNGVKIGQTYSGSDDYNSASRVAFIQLNAGDMVWVSHMDTSKSEGTYGFGYCSFGGALLN